MREWEKMTTGRLYNPADAEIGRHHIRGMSLCDRFNRTPFLRAKKKQKLLEKLIPSAIGKNLTVFSPLHCEYGENIFVGKDCFLNYGCTLLTLRRSRWRMASGSARTWSLRRRCIRI